jgi:hypothetical protein
LALFQPKIRIGIPIKKALKSRLIAGHPIRPVGFCFATLLWQNVRKEVNSVLLMGLGFDLRIVVLLEARVRSSDVHCAQYQILASNYSK